MPVQPFEAPEKKKKPGFWDYLSTGMSLASTAGNIAANVNSIAKGNEAKASMATLTENPMYRRRIYG